MKPNHHRLRYLKAEALITRGEGNHERADALMQERAELLDQIGQEPPPRKKVLRPSR